jgi:glycerol-3-phosphate dehydrogenase (NAD(P)+)
MRIRAAVLGAGSWGTTVAHLLAQNTPTVLWARDPILAASIAADGVNARYLPDHPLHPALEVTADIGEAVGGADVVIMGVPSHGFRGTVEQLAGSIRAWVPVISLAKGLEAGTDLRMTQVVHDVLPGHPYGVLTGPNLAHEILDGHAAATVLAMSDTTIAERLAELFTTDRFRVYTNHDVVGCEIAGALKNVIAIAAGMADGLGAGDNTRAAIVTRGLAELTRLGVALGGEPLTFAGLAGLGDLVVTSFSPQSRNRRVGEQLGRGRSIADIVADTPMVAEGIRTAPVVVDLGRRHGVEMPIAEQVGAVIAGEVAAADAYRRLLERPSRPEMHGLHGLRGE